MRRKTSSKFQCGVSAAVLAAAAVATVAGVSSSQAGIIYQDNFARTGNLAGSTPAPTDATASTWTVSYPVGATAPTTSTTNGGEAAFTNQTYTVAADLPFTLQASVTYAFTVTVTPAKGSTTNWLAMGFGNAAFTGTQQGINNGETEAWLLYRDTGGTQSFYGGGVANPANGGGGSANSGTADTFTITLTTPASLSSGTASVSMYDSLDLIGSNASPRTGTLTSTELAYVDSIIIGSEGTGGTFSGLELSTVPEPATLGLMGAGGLVLLLAGRKRKTV